METATNGDNTSVEFERKKVAYCARFAVSHTRAFRPHWKKGETLGKRPEVWRNVSQHCLVEGIFADILAEETGLDPHDRTNVVEATLKHDWGKKDEVLGMNEALGKGEMTLKRLEQIKNEDSRILREMGTSEKVIKLIGSIVPETEEGPQTLPEKIVWYADMILSGTEPITIKERVDNWERGWDGTKEDPVRTARNQGWSNAYKEKYGGKSLGDIQRSVGEKIEKELAQLIGFKDDPSLLPFYLKERFMERVNKFP